MTLRRLDLLLSFMDPLLEAYYSTFRGYFKIRSWELASFYHSFRYLFSGSFFLVLSTRSFAGVCSISCTMLLTDNVTCGLDSSAPSQFEKLNM